MNTRQFNELYELLKEIREAIKDMKPKRATSTRSPYDAGGWPGRKDA